MYEGRSASPEITEVQSCDNNHSHADSLKLREKKKEECPGSRSYSGSQSLLVTTGIADKSPRRSAYHLLLVGCRRLAAHPYLDSPPHGARAPT